MLACRNAMRLTKKLIPKLFHFFSYHIATFFTFAMLSIALFNAGFQTSNGVRICRRFKASRGEVFSERDTSTTKQTTTHTHNPFRDCHLRTLSTLLLKAGCFDSFYPAFKSRLF
jgi:hypothetical protein